MADARASARKRSETTHLGWRHEVLVPDPGPPPRRPAPSERERVSPEWIAAQRRSEADLNRPLVIVLVALAAIAVLFVLLWPARILPGLFSLVGCLACLLVAVPVLFALMQGRQAVGERLEREERRLEEARAEQERLLRERQEEHARRHTEWQARKRAHEAQPRWYGVTVPPGIATVAVAGGTDAGWSAVLTTIGAARLRDGGDLTIVDLSGRAVAGDLVSLAQRCGVAPRVWVLPADLPRMNLGLNLDGSDRATILASTVLATDPRADIDGDHAFLEKVFGIVGADATVALLTAALRALGLPEGSDTGEDDPGLAPLTPRQHKELREAFEPDRALMERAWELERALIPFEGLGTRAADEPYAQVKIIATDRTSGEFAGRAYGTYTLDALSELLDLRARRGNGNGGGARPWAHTIVVCGAGALPDWEVDRLVSAADGAGAGIVLMYRETTEHAAAVMGGERCLPVVMRQPDAGSAERAAGLLDGAHEFALQRLTEVIGEALSDTIADSYVTDPATSVTVGMPTRYVSRSVAPLDLVRNMRAATAWGRTTAQAAEIDGTEEPGGRDRPLRGDAYGLCTLPPTAMIVAGDAPILADANPGILTLPTATLSTVDDAHPTRPPESEGDEPPPNIGPPPERLDWRRTAGR
ncbi:hypothetical protein HDA32_000225 [Spinactinospora alkalitolerans]|uniref:Uncharacterized protein n=1 Tax=Spinactinospora alkalitolerans TaxID=687207 RepID=A0A852TND0_9ACTN|nr:hypothetical protein [Spinactinospora alkalitolerans]NYE45105.1 hypothetical protein [Spinactinospora alkalitolerans]